MRKNPRLWGLAAVLVIAAALASTIGIASARAAAVCTQTGFFRDGINLTAAVINPATPSPPRLMPPAAISASTTAPAPVGL